MLTIERSADEVERIPRIDTRVAPHVRGVETFLRLVHRECSALYLFGDLPDEIKNRIHSVARDAERVAEFASGFVAAQAIAEEAAATEALAAASQVMWVARAIVEQRARKPATGKKTRKGARR